MRFRVLIVVALAVCLLSLASPPSAQGCEDCRYSPNGWGMCRYADDGYKVCRTVVVDSFSGRTDCQISQDQYNFCTSSSEGGGGGGGGGCAWTDMWGHCILDY